MKYSTSLAASMNCGLDESTVTSSKPGGVISTAMSWIGFGNLGENRILVAISGTGLRADDADERLQAAVRIHRQLAVQVERPRQHVLPRRAAAGETEIFHQHQLGRREAVVNF